MDPFGIVEWFPQQHAATFYLTKGFLAVFATVLVVFHMGHTWGNVTTAGRRWRYGALLGSVMLIAFASAEQIQNTQMVNYRNLGALLVLVVVIYGMYLSIREDLRT